MAARKRGTLRLGQRRGGSHPRVFSTDGKHRGAHNNKGPNHRLTLCLGRVRFTGGRRTEGGHTRSGTDLSCRRDRNDFRPCFELVEVVRPLLHH
ncbi:hypothetical protein BOC38_02875 [Burkholderia pseudomallei]|nr:hypothetical protein BOC38_02875 [Burkholderia pseudomallei]